ncbi:hypothetical protein Ddc_10124 [Ditylenchus destructor]|nr:hypothetical protein Ddc_10124 [Ditylenchus destructor]
MRKTLTVLLLLISLVFCFNSYKIIKAKFAKDWDPIICSTDAECPPTHYCWNEIVGGQCVEKCAPFC